MPATRQHVRELEVPVIVELGRRTMTVREVMSLLPGAIVELPKSADEELELLVNNRTIAVGSAVKVGENFGIRLSAVGTLGQRVAAATAEPGDGVEHLAEQLIAEH